jgi:hypothetical protein
MHLTHEHDELRRTLRRFIDTEIPPARRCVGGRAPGVDRRGADEVTTGIIARNMGMAKRTLPS